MRERHVEGPGLPCAHRRPNRDMVYSSISADGEVFFQTNKQAKATSVFSHRPRGDGSLGRLERRPLPTTSPLSSSLKGATGEASGLSLTSRYSPAPHADGPCVSIGSECRPGAVSAKRGAGDPAGLHTPDLRSSRVPWCVPEVHPGLPDVVVSGWPTEPPLSPAGCQAAVQGCSREASAGGLRGGRGPLAAQSPFSEGGALGSHVVCVPRRPTLCLPFASNLRLTSSG